MSNVIAFMTPVFRVSYARVFEPSVFVNNQNLNVQQAIAQGMGERLAFSLTALFPKDPARYPQSLDPSLRACDLTQIQHQAFYAAMEHAKLGPMLQANNNQWPANLLWPLKDCDTDPDDKLKPECQGMMSMKMVSPCKNGTGTLQIVDQNVQPIVDRNAFYSGCWARAHGIMWAYDNMSKGVRFTLNCLQKVADGEPLSGGGAQASAVFAPVPGGAPMGAPMGMPGQPQQQTPQGYGAPMQQPGMMPQGQPMQQPGGYAPPAPQMPQQQPGMAPAAPAFPGMMPQNPLG